MTTRPYLKMASLAGLVSFISTAGSVLGVGWNIHKSILEDVTISQQKVMEKLEEKFSLMLNSKLEKEPATFQISTQSRQLEVLIEKVQSAESKLVEVKSSIDDIKNILYEKQNRRSERNL